MICPKCGTKMQDGSKMCIRCGSIVYANGMVLNDFQSNQNNQVNNQQSQNSQMNIKQNNLKQNSNSKKTLSPFLIVIIVIVVLVGGFFALSPIISTFIISNQINQAEENAVKDIVYGVFDAVKLQYTEQLYSQNTDVQYEGDVTSLNLSGTKPDSGRWSIDKMTGEVTIKDVVYETYNYICNGTKNDLICKKK